MPEVKIGLSWRAAAWIVGSATLAFLVLWLAPIAPLSLGLKTYAPLHTILEIFAVAVALTIFAVGWHARVTSDSGILPAVAIGFLAVALLDTAHLLSYPGMPDWITPSGGGKAINFWFAARYAAIFALLVLVLPRKQVGFHPATIKIALSVALGYTVLSYWLVLGRPDLLPVFIVPGQGLTPIKVFMEWGLVLISALAIVVVWRRRTQHRLYDPASLLVALSLSILSELCFTLYSHVDDLFNILGHAFKVLSYGFLYKSLVTGSVKLPYRLLAESQGVLQQLTDNIRQVFWMTSADNKQMLYVSPAYASIWGRPCDSLLRAPESWLDAIHPDDRLRVAALLNTQTDELYSVEYRILRPDGSERWIHDQAFPILGASGEIQRSAGIAEDITEQKHSSLVVREGRELLGLFIDNAPVALAMFDREMRYLGASRRWIMDYGLADQDIIGHTHYEIFPEIPEHWKAIHRRGLAGETIRNEEEAFTRLDGSVQWLRWEVLPWRTATGEIGGIIIFTEDITQSKQAETDRQALQRQLLQSQKMESIGHLAGGIAHDFNNMLGAILGYAELLQINTAATTTPERTQKYIGEILTAGNRAKELIAQMLVFSRLPTELPGGATPDILLQPVLKEAIHLLRSSIPSTIEVNYQIADAALRANIQPVQLHQILLNLAINARDAIGEYGRIDVKLAHATLSGICDACHAPFDGDFVAISVSDSGKGIPMDLLPKIFDPFFTTKDIGKGTGMGLSVVHGIVHSLNGHIAVQNAAGQGTVIRILLPTAATQASNPKVPCLTNSEPIGGELSGLHIMVVDDEHAMTSMRQELLSLHGAVVASYNQAPAALAAFRQDPHGFDLVITDETMPSLSGLDIAKTMLQLRPGLPIILCTGYSEHVNAEIAQQHGIAGFMHKPLDLQALLHLAASLCNKDQTQ